MESWNYNTQETETQDNSGFSGFLIMQTIRQKYYNGNMYVQTLIQQGIFPSQMEMSSIAKLAW